MKHVFGSIPCRNAMYVSLRRWRRVCYLAPSTIREEEQGNRNLLKFELNVFWIYAFKIAQFYILIYVTQRFILHFSIYDPSFLSVTLSKKILHGKNIQEITWKTLVCFFPNLKPRECWWTATEGVLVPQRSSRTEYRNKFVSGTARRGGKLNRINRSLEGQE